MVPTRQIQLAVAAALLAGCTSDDGLKVHNDAPVASIELPLDGETVVEGAEVLLQGRVSDRQDAAGSLGAAWFLDGSPVCEDAAVDDEGVVACTVRLTAAATVVLRATDGDGATGEDQISLALADDAAPTVSLDAPTAAAVLYATRTAELLATVADDRDATETLDVGWSTADGPVDLSWSAVGSDGLARAEATLPAGAITLTATVTDSLGQSASDTVTLTVHAENTLPDCAFTAPDADAEVALGASLRIAGTATDNETPATALDGSLSSSLDGPLLSGAFVAADGQWSHTTDALSAGTHELTLTLTDDYGESCVERHTLTVCDTVWYADADGDGHGDPSSATVACAAPSGFVASADDCDDSQAGVFPSAAEVCDTVDNDCDALVDDDDSDLDLSTATTFWTDADGDGEGDPDAPWQACVQPSGTASTATDCDDSDPTVGLGATEVCDGQDNDCDALVDDEDGDLDRATASTWAADSDGDGYGDPAVTATACVAPSGYLADDTDCDDTDPWTFPGATELCDGVQNDCSDTAWTDDDGLASVYTDSSASWADATATFGAGTLASPAALTLSTAGTVHLCAGTWPVHLTATASVDIVGVDGATDVILSGGDSGTIFSTTTDSLALSLTGLTLQDGLGTQTLSTTGSASTNGGAVFCDAASTLRLDAVVFTENTADSGGALAAAGCDVTADGVTWSDNTATVVASAAHSNGGTWTETSGRYADNTAPKGGLQLYNTTATLTDVVFDGNTATEGGHPALYLGAGSTLDATRLTVQNSQSGTDTSGGEYYGGALWLYTGSTVTLDQSTFANNHADNIAGAIYVVGADLTVTDTTFSGNTAVGRGGALFVRDGSTVRTDADTVFSGNTSDGSGGAVYVAEDCTIQATGTEFSLNQADGEGGALYLVDATLTASSGALFDQNTSAGDGGAVALAGPDGVLSLTATDLTTNSATGSGGAIALLDDGGSPDATLSGGSVRSNTAGVDGGGILVSGTLSATSVDFSGTNSPSDTTAGTDDDTWGSSASFSCTSTGCG